MINYLWLKSLQKLLIFDCNMPLEQVIYTADYRFCGASQSSWNHRYEHSRRDDRTPVVCHAALSYVLILTGNTMEQLVWNSWQCCK